MKWNYRVLANEYQVGDLPKQVCFDIYSVYYSDEGIAHSCSATPAQMASEDMEDLLGTLKLLKEATTKAILWGDERFPAEYKPDESVVEINEPVELEELCVAVGTKFKVYNLSTVYQISKFETNGNILVTWEKSFYDGKSGEETYNVESVNNYFENGSWKVIN